MHGQIQIAISWLLQSRRHLVDDSSFSRYTLLIDLSDLTDFLVDLYSLLLFVLIIWQYTHNPANTGNIK